MNEDVRKTWEEFLDPDVMRQRLISASLYIAAYQSLRSCIVDRVRGFFWCGFDANGDKFDPKYEKDVLSRNRSAVHASLDWLRELGAIDEADITGFSDVTRCRNQLSHTLLDLLGNDGLPKDFDRCFTTVISLLKKIEVWWIINIEDPTEESGLAPLDPEEVVPGRVLVIQMLLDIALGSEKESRQWLDAFRKHSTPRTGSP